MSLNNECLHITTNNSEDFTPFSSEDDIQPNRMIRTVTTLTPGAAIRGRHESTVGTDGVSATGMREAKKTRKHLTNKALRDKL